MLLEFFLLFAVKFILWTSGAIVLGENVLIVVCFAAVTVCKRRKTKCPICSKRRNIVKKRSEALEYLSRSMGKKNGNERAKGKLTGKDIVVVPSEQTKSEILIEEESDSFEDESYELYEIDSEQDMSNVQFVGNEKNVLGEEGGASAAVSANYDNVKPDDHVKNASSES